MDRYEYIHIPFRWIPEEEIKQQYNLYALLVQADGFVYCKVCKGMYGLKQSATLLLMDTILFGKLQASGLMPLKILFSLCVWTILVLNTQILMMLTTFFLL